MFIFKILAWHNNVAYNLNRTVAVLLGKRKAEGHNAIPQLQPEWWFTSFILYVFWSFLMVFSYKFKIPLQRFKANSETWSGTIMSSTCPFLYWNVTIRFFKCFWKTAVNWGDETNLIQGCRPLKFSPSKQSTCHTKRLKKTIHNKILFFLNLPSKLKKKHL